MTQIVLPLGRIVQGHPMEPQTKDMDNRPLTNTDGTPRTQYFFALAVPKTDPEINGKIAQIQQIAAEAWPQGQSQQQGFAWKFVDGDQPPQNQKEGFPGHFVFKLTNGFPINCVTADGASEILDKNQIKCGFYGRAVINVAGNKSTSKPGIYLNPSIFELRGVGEEIKTGPDAAAILSAAPAAAALPQGATPAPVGAMPITGQVISPGGQGVPPNAANVTPAGPPATPQNVTPAPEFLNPVGGQTVPPGGQTVPPVPTSTPPGIPPVKQMTAKANGIPYERYIAQGWTDEQLIQQGFMLDEIPF